MAKTFNFVGSPGLNKLVEKTKALVNAVKETAENAQKDAQTASTEAKYYGTCATAEGTTAKVVTCSNFKLLKGARIAVTFTHANTAGSPTMNVNSTGAKPMKWHGGSTVGSKAWVADETCLFAYDGTNWVLIKSKIPAWTDMSDANPIAKGGTGATTYAQALKNLHASADDHNHDTVYMKKTDTVAVANGGTGATTAQQARTNLGITLANLGAAASSHSHNPSDINTDDNAMFVTKAEKNSWSAKATSGHTHDLGTDKITGTLPVTKGGTGATTAAQARVNLGIDTSNFAAKTHSHGLASADMTGTLPISKGGTGATSASAALTALGGATMVLINVSVDTSWGGSASAGFTKTVSVSGVKSTDVPVVGIVMSSDINAAKLQGAAFANVNRITTANNSITLYAFSAKPTTAFTLQMLIVRKG